MVVLRSPRQAGATLLGAVVLAMATAEVLVVVLSWQEEVEEVLA